jgi:MAE_28990/MAE_18760-like HEPN
MTPWEEIEQDLSWREAEMGSLKLALAAAPKDSARHRSLLRACCTMLYAHYEGFCKFCWTLMLQTIEAEVHLRGDLADPLAKYSMAQVFKTLRGDLSDASLWKFATADFRGEMQLPATFPIEIDTKSNLWPKLAREINTSVGLQCSLFDSHDFELRQLVARRNDIAHGQKLVIADVTQFQKYEHAVIMVMHDLAVAVVDCLTKKEYLLQLQDPAALI